MPDAACSLYRGRTHCIHCGKCKEEEEWTRIKAKVCAVVIECLKARGCRMTTLEEQMEILCDPARHVR
ncbi:MAG: hypothetical protein WC343_08235 [Bacilli bacterium]|jgi:hypothetical protein